MKMIGRSEGANSSRRLRSFIACFTVVALAGVSLASGCFNRPEPESPAAPEPVEEITPESEAPQAEIPRPDAGEPPEIPPISTFIIDFDNFLSDDDESSDIVGTEQSFRYAAHTPQVTDLFAEDVNDPAEQKNWGFAALNVGFWNVVLFVGLAIPVASFIESFNHSPEQQPDYTWVWSYEVPFDGDVFSAELHGRFVDNGVRWEMYVSKEGGYQDFQWYYGESNLPATEGFWILKKNHADPSDLLRIDWYRDIASASSDIQYTNIVPGGPENGGYIFYEVNESGRYDRAYEIYNKGKDNTTYIEWNVATQEGRVKDSRHFGDSDWHCWGMEHEDTECP